MSNVVSLPNKRDWKYHADRINAAWGKQVESILETGRYLLEAQEELDKDAFEAMCNQKLSFKASAVSKLMTIAEKTVFFSYRKKTPIPLPPNWVTLYQLSQLDDATLQAKIADGTIHSKLEQREAVRLVEELRGPSLIERVQDAFVKAKDGLTSDELHKQIGGDVASHTIRGYVSRMAKRGELKSIGERKTGRDKSAMVYALNENYVPTTKQNKPAKVAPPPQPEPPTVINPQAQRDEMRRSYVTFLQTLSKEDQVEELGKIIRRELVGWSTKEISALLKITTFNIKLK